jgi:hypothetical protein
MEVIRSSETSVVTRTTRRNTPEDDILHCHRRENLKSYSDSSVVQLTITAMRADLSYYREHNVCDKDRLTNPRLFERSSRINIDIFYIFLQVCCCFIHKLINLS